MVFPMPQVALVVALILQGTGSFLLGRYTRLAVPTKELYDVNNFILVSECVKLLLSGLVEASHGRLLRGLREHVLEEPSQFLKSSVPVLLYLVSNTSLYMAITHLSLPLHAYRDIPGKAHCRSRDELYSIESHLQPETVVLSGHPLGRCDHGCSE